MGQSVNGAQTFQQILAECKELKVLRMTVVRNSGAGTSSNSTPTRSVGRKDLPQSPSGLKVPTVMINGKAQPVRQQSDVAVGLAGTNERKPRDRANIAVPKQRGRMDVQRSVPSPNESPASSMSGISDTARPAYAFSGGVAPGKAMSTLPARASSKQGVISDKRNSLNVTRSM